MSIDNIIYIKLKYTLTNPINVMFRIKFWTLSMILTKIFSLFLQPN